MDKTSITPNLWDSKPVNGNGTNQRASLEQTFIDKAFIENFFDKHLSIAKGLLQAENLPYDTISIDFSTLNFCFVVSICFDRFKEHYNENLKHASVNTMPTANIRDAIEAAVSELKSNKKPVFAIIQHTTPETTTTTEHPEPEPKTMKVKQITIDEAIEAEQTKGKKEKKDKSINE